jgi:hypothetical protein
MRRRRTTVVAKRGEAHKQVVAPVNCSDADGPQADLSRFEISQRNNVLDVRAAQHLEAARFLVTNFLCAAFGELMTIRNCEASSAAQGSARFH